MDEIVWQPRETAHYWDAAVVHRNGRTIYIETPLRGDHVNKGQFFIYLFEGEYELDIVGHADFSSAKMWRALDALTAQAILLHLLHHNTSIT